MPNQGLFHACSSIEDGESGICWVNWRTDVTTHIDKPFFTHFEQFSKRLFDFNHSYLSQITIKLKTNISKFKLAHW